MSAIFYEKNAFLQNLKKKKYLVSRVNGYYGYLTHRGPSTSIASIPWPNGLGIHLGTGRSKVRYPAGDHSDMAGC